MEIDEDFSDLIESVGKDDVVNNKGATAYAIEKLRLFRVEAVGDGHPASEMARKIYSEIRRCKREFDDEYQRRSPRFAERLARGVYDSPGAPRSAEWQGGRYVIRDVWVPDVTRMSGERLLRCEYKVRREGEDVWLPTYEGVLFADIEPYEIAA